MTTKTVPIVVIAIAGALTLSLTFLLYPAFTGPKIDATWVIAYNKNSVYDTKSAEWVQEAYGGTLQDINEAYEWDNFGQNIFIIGGSEALSIEAQWIGLDPKWYSIAKPDTYPEVTWTKNEATGKLTLVTPSREYDCIDASEHDWGTIAKGYDYTKRRWVIVVIGWTRWATATGSRLVVEDYKTVVEQNRYVIYEVTKRDTTTEIAQWSLSDFEGEIVEYGA